MFPPYQNLQRSFSARSPTSSQYDESGDDYDRHSISACTDLTSQCGHPKNNQGYHPNQSGNYYQGVLQKTTSTTQFHRQDMQPDQCGPMCHGPCRWTNNRPIEYNRHISDDSMIDTGSLPGSYSEPPYNNKGRYPYPIEKKKTFPNKILKNPIIDQDQNQQNNIPQQQPFNRDFNKSPTSYPAYQQQARQSFTLSHSNSLDLPDTNSTRHPNYPNKPTVTFQRNTQTLPRLKPSITKTDYTQPPPRRYNTPPPPRTYSPEVSPKHNYKTISGRPSTPAISLMGCSEESSNSSSSATTLSVGQTRFIPHVNSVALRLAEAGKDGNIGNTSPKITQSIMKNH